MTGNGRPSRAWIARFVARAITLRPGTSLALACEIAHEVFHEGWRESPNAAAETWHHLLAAIEIEESSESTSAKVSVSVAIAIDNGPAVNRGEAAPHERDFDTRADYLEQRTAVRLVSPSSRL